MNLCMISKYHSHLQTRTMMVMERQRLHLASMAIHSKQMLEKDHCCLQNSL
ncbi:hypothetical protein Lalb_Chr18g0048531 [Lupinus albus]|uniref:Uncharacterized protein n=1 Tax=Lupinus albus TaxID=3870 RepID=A0A6A4P309_LUPAL|nr:hypothetical protein Lalb_Chr18g0048531 [Lupinus albus]